MLLFFNDTSKEVQEMLKTAHADTLKRKRFQACKYIDLELQRLTYKQSSWKPGYFKIFFC
jgi:hypothetical protein